jgi:hypothetical protein
MIVNPIEGQELVLSELLGYGAATVRSQIPSEQVFRQPVLSDQSEPFSK